MFFMLFNYSTAPDIQSANVRPSYYTFNVYQTQCLDFQLSNVPTHIYSQHYYNSTCFFMFNDIYIQG
jgi:hypothetical protein